MMTGMRTLWGFLLAAATFAGAAQTPTAPPALKPTLALVGGQVIDGYEVPPIRDSLRNITQLDYFTLTFRRIPTLQRKFQQLRDTGVTLLVGTDSGIPANLHSDCTWRELDTWVRFGMTPMQAIAGATRWPARFLNQEQNLGTLAPGRLADVIAVRGDVLSNVTLLQSISLVVKGGVRVK